MERWIFRKRFRFCLETVVHICSGISALVLASLIQFYKYFHKGIKPSQNVMPISLFMGLIWFGWFGFNGGSQLAVGDEELP